MRTIAHLLPILLLMAAPSSAQSAQPLFTVPFVGCPADGQLGPVPAEHHKPLRLAIPPQAASRLAYYHAVPHSDELGLLAPRGWHCFGTYGLNGYSLFVSPEPISANKFFGRQHWEGITGPGIQLTLEYGGTSGRFGVAQTIVQLFPKHTRFVTRLIADEQKIGGFVPKYEHKSFPSDRLHYKSDHLVEFTTPPNMAGVGTDESWLRPAAGRISGMMYLGGFEKPEDDVFLVRLFVRLPPDLDSLAPVITDHEERRASGRLP